MPRTIPFGRFVLIEPRGSIFGHVVIAPEYVLLQRTSYSSIRDVSYLAIWGADRERAIARELSSLASGGVGSVKAVTAGASETLAILRAIAPLATPLFVDGGECHKTLRALMRRQLAGELRAAARQGLGDTLQKSVS